MNKIIALVLALAAFLFFWKIYPAQPMTEIELSSTREFGVTDALPELHIGSARFRLSRLAVDRTDRIIFSIGDEDYRSLPDGAPMTLMIGRTAVWDFGAFHKP